ncbi:MAG: FecR domain-containing protein [Planctomycetia bacterium]|nr:FecR domain-containing protein [Planctomycetia bacterium]
MTRPGDPLARALDALPPAPPPPPVAGVWEAARHDGRVRARRRAMLAVAAGLLLAVGVSVAVRPPGAGRTDATRSATVTLALGRTATPEALVVRRGGEAMPRADEDLAPGDDVEARDAAVVALASGARLALEPGARLTLTSGARVAQHDGRVRYEVDHDPRRPFTVVAAGVEIVDVGTRFVVDVAPRATGEGGSAPGGDRVLVTVEHGEVRVSGRALGAGLGRALVDGRAVGDDWPLDGRPVLSLDVETANPTAREPVVCRVTLHNPTDAWLPLPAADAGPVWLEVVGPDGTRVPVRITEAMRLPPRSATAIPPRGEVVVRVQFERTFASPGAYRLRAVYRPADAVEPPRSPEALLTVR